MMLFVSMDFVRIFIYILRFQKRFVDFVLCKSLLKIQKMCISPSNEKWNEKDEVEKDVHNFKRSALSLSPQKWP